MILNCYVNLIHILMKKHRLLHVFGHANIAQIRLHGLLLMVATNIY